MTKDRKESLIQLLKEAQKPMNGQSLAEYFHVTRQIIVQDIAVLRANGAPILSTNRGYIYKENKSEKFVAFGLTYPNNKGVPLKKIDSIANQLKFLLKNVYAKTGYISYRMEIADEMITPFVIIMCKYVFYFGLLAGDNSRGPKTMIVLLGVRKYEEK